MQADSVVKIVTRYFACLSRESFEFAGKTFEPKPLTVSPLLLRGYTCPSHCGGCCHLRFSLDYLPTEPRPEGLTKRWVDFNGARVKIFSDFQTKNTTNHCQHLDEGNGRCGVYFVRPFSCDFELIRTLEYSSEHPNVLTQKLFGRGWNMKRIDGERGALCEMTPITVETINDVVRKLLRLKEWSDHFGIETWVPTIVDLIQSRRLQHAVTLDPQPKRNRRLLRKNS